MTLMEFTGSLNIIGYAMAGTAPAVGIAWIFVTLINGIARQPEAAGAMRSAAMIGFVVIEAIAIFAFVLAFVL